MFYVSRIIDISKPPITMNELVSQIMKLDSKFLFDGKVIFFDGQPFCEANILLSGSECFFTEVKKLRSLAEQSAVYYRETSPVEFVINWLDNASSIITFRSHWPAETDDQNKMFETFDPIWDMLMETRDGLLHIDFGSFSNKDGKVLFSNGPRVLDV